MPQRFDTGVSSHRDRSDGTEGQVGSDARRRAQSRTRSTVQAATAVGSGRSTPVRLLQLYAIALFAFPSNMVIKAIGANGYVSSLVGLAGLGLWMVASALGRHDPLSFRNPIRLGLGMMWCASLLSYALMNRYIHPPSVQLASDRWLLQLAMISGVVLLAAEGLRDMVDIRKVAKAFVLGASICGVVALLQFTLHVDLTPYLRMIPAFSENGEAAAFTPRDGLTRVAGTSLHPIELGVVSSMALPIALWVARFDTSTSLLRRWGPSGIITAAAVLSVSRSAIVALVAAVALLLVLLPAKDRAVGILLAPIALGAIFMSVPGFFRTMLNFFSRGASGADPSVQARTDDYALVAEYTAESPLFGQGPGAYVRKNALEILDNQYLSTTMDLGFMGLIALVVFLVLPITMCLSTRRRSDDPQLRWLCAAIAASAAGATLCTFTFDSFSFPMFVGTQCLLAGLAGACWALNPPRRRRVRTDQPLQGATAHAA